MAFPSNGIDYVRTNVDVSETDVFVFPCVQTCDGRTTTFRGAMPNQSPCHGPWSVMETSLIHRIVCHCGIRPPQCLPHPSQTHFDSFYR